MDEQNRNLILATALSALVILVWMVLFPPAEVPVETADTTTSNQPATTGTGANGVAVTPSLQGDTTATPTLATTAADTRAAAIGKTDRVTIETPRLSGSISLAGGRIDDLSLLDYRTSLDEGAPTITLLSPAGGPNPYYAVYGWAAAAGVKSPGAGTLWSVEKGQTLGIDRPVTLIWDNGAGLVFRRVISVDADYMFTITQSVENKSENPVTLRPYGIVARHGEPETIGFYILHEGVVMSTDGTLDEIDYDDMPDAKTLAEGGQGEITDVAANGWIGFTDKYWMTTLIPTPGTAFQAVTKYSTGADIYQTEIRLPTQTIAPGAATTATSTLFAGAKEWEAIRHYQDEDGIEQFIDSIDWGWFYFLTKPMFWVLHVMHGMIGNMGLAIIALTIVIKIILFPLAYKSFVSMARMKELQPEMEKLKERFGDDRQKMQQETMKLYRDKKVNPAAGCLPILIQIPIFFSLYKVIFVTIEMYHAPFFGWIKDLSAPDPSSFMNLFGLLPYAAPGPESLFAIFSIGVFPILMGVSMWMQQKLNPAPSDPTQAMIFAWMPWVFMFMLGQFASGLVVYWVANNTITFLQQYTIMRSQGVKPDVFGNIKATFKRKPKDKA